MSLLSFFGQEIKTKPVPVDIPDGVILHISQAAFAEETAEGEIARIFVQADDQKFALCTLVGQSKESQPLDLNFDPDTNVAFFVQGSKTPVHLTGYYNLIDESIDGDEADFDEDEQPMFNVADDSDSDDNNEMNLSNISESSTSKLLSAYANADEDESDDEEFEPNHDELNDSRDYKLDLSQLEDEGADNDDDDENDSEDDAEDEKLIAKIAQMKQQTDKKEKQQQQGKKRKAEESTPVKQNKKQKQNNNNTPQKSPAKNHKNDGGKKKKNKKK